MRCCQLFTEHLQPPDSVDLTGFSRPTEEDEHQLLSSRHECKTLTQGKKSTNKSRMMKHTPFPLPSPCWNILGHILIVTQRNSHFYRASPLYFLKRIESLAYKLIYCCILFIPACYLNNDSTLFKFFLKLFIFVMRLSIRATSSFLSIMTRPLLQCAFFYR